MNAHHGNKAHPYKDRGAVYTLICAKKERNGPVSALLAQNLSSKQIAHRSKKGEWSANEVVKYRASIYSKSCVIPC